MNSFITIDPSKDDVDITLPFDSGYGDKVAAGDTADVLWDAAGSTSRAFPKALKIEVEDWEDHARENDKYFTHPVNYVDRFTNQNPTHECTSHSWTRAFEGCWNRFRGINFKDGPKKGYRYPESSKFDVVWMSPLSLYCRANPGRWGGAGVRQVLEISVEEGVLPDKLQPRDYKFKHSLHGTSGQGNSNQSSGGWVTKKSFGEGWEETASLFRPKEVVFPASWEEAVCLVLHGYFVCVGRNGHAIPWGQPIFNNGRLTHMAYVDSYDVIRYDSLATVKSAWRGAFAITSTTQPDNWADLAA